MNNCTLFLTLLSVTSIYGGDVENPRNHKDSRNFNPQTPRHVVHSPKKDTKTTSPLEKLAGLSSQAALAKLGALKPKNLFANEIE